MLLLVNVSDGKLVPVSGYVGPPAQVGRTPGLSEVIVIEPAVPLVLMVKRAVTARALISACARLSLPRTSAAGIGYLLKVSINELYSEIRIGFCRRCRGALGPLACAVGAAAFPACFR